MPANKTIQYNNKDDKNQSNFIQCFVEVGMLVMDFFPPLAISSLWFKGIFFSDEVQVSDQLVQEPSGIILYLLVYFLMIRYMDKRSAFPLQFARGERKFAHSRLYGLRV